MRGARILVGYLFLLAAGVGFLVTRAIILPFIDGGPEVLGVLPKTLAVGIPTVIIAALGIWLLISQPAMRALLISADVIAAGPTLFGVILTISDINAGGYNNIGASIMIMFGNSLLIAGAILVFGTAVGCAINQVLVSRKSLEN